MSKNSLLSINSLKSQLGAWQIWVIFLGFFVFLTFQLDRFPGVWLDEAWTLMAPLELVENGKLANPVLTGRGDGLEEHLLWPQLTQRIALAGWIKMFGMGIVSARFLSVVFAMICVGGVYIFHRRIFPETTATLACFLFAIDGVIFVTGRTIRAEIFVTVFAFFAVCLLFIALGGNRKRYLSFLGGILGGCALYTHPNSLLILGGAVISALIVYRINNKKSWLTLMYFCIGCIVGFLPYAVYVAIEDAQNGFAHFMAQVGAGDRLDNNYSLLDKLHRESVRYQGYILFPKRFLIFLVQAVAVLAALRSRNLAIKSFAIIVVIFLSESE